jgi:hypothetical protein
METPITVQTKQVINWVMLSRWWWMHSYIDLHNITMEETRQIPFSFLGSLPSSQLYSTYMMRFVCEWVTFWGQVKGNLPNTSLWLVCTTKLKACALRDSSVSNLNRVHRGDDRNDVRFPRHVLTRADTCWHGLLTSRKKLLPRICWRTGNHREMWLLDVQWRRGKSYRKRIN